MKARFIKFGVLCLVFSSSLVSCNSDGNETTTLFDTWRLTSFENTLTNIIIRQQSEPEQVIITFNETGFYGNTGRNELTANITFEPNGLIITNISGTEINESKWGRQFLEGLVQNFDSGTGIIRLEYTLTGNNLKLKYGEHQYMNFIRI